jgi:osmotically inducible protein OsmC
MGGWTLDFHLPALRELARTPSSCWRPLGRPAFITAIKHEAEETEGSHCRDPWQSTPKSICARGGGTYGLRVRLNVSLPGLAREAARALVDAAHQACPFSKATRGKVDVAINLL